MSEKVNQLSIPQSNSQQPSSPSSQKLNPLFSALIMDPDTNKAYLGPFQFDLEKLNPLMEDPELIKLLQYPKCSIDTSENVTVQAIPYEYFKAVTFFVGKHFKPAHKSYQIIQNVPFTITISHINFTNLTVLNLSKQNLTSVEPLAFLNAPKLACLELYANQIYSMEPLVKGKFTKLRILTFYHNPIAKMDQFYRIQNKKLDQFEFDNNQKAKILMEDYRFMSKMESIKLKTLKMWDPERINLKGRGNFNKLEQTGAQIAWYEKPFDYRRRRMLRD